MQELHLVGFTTDLEALIFSTRKGAKSGSFVVSLDTEVIAKIEEALRLRTGGEGTGLARRGRSLTAMAAPRQESSLSPKQMQAKLRSGRSISDVAREAGVDDEWVARFAAPILAEQAQIIGEARGRLMTKPRLGNSSQALDTAVRWNLGDRGIYLDDDEYELGWGARNLRDTLWLVTFVYESRKREQRAEWELEHTSTKLTPKNRLASDLGYVEPGRRRGPIPPRPSPLLPTRVATQIAAPVPDEPTPAKLTPTQKKALAKKAAAEKAAAKRAAVKQAAADREAARKLAKRLAVQRAAAKRAAAKQAATAKKTAARLAAAQKLAEERAVKAAAAKARAAKKAAADKEKARKAAARKAAAKKAIPRKKKAAAKKAAARKVAKKTGSKKAAPRKAAAKKSARKTAPKKTAARRPTARKAPARRPATPARKSPAARKPPKGPKKAAPRKAAAKKSAARKGAARKATPRRVTPVRRAAPARVTPVVRQAPAALRPVASSGGGEVGKSAAAAYLEARRRGPGEPVRPAAVTSTPTPRPVAAPVRAASGAPPVVIRAAPASAGPVEPEPLPDVSGNGAEADESVGRSRLRRRRPLRGRS